MPADNIVRRNVLVANYGAGFGVDNDDTSSYYTIKSNVFYGGGGVKCDYDGHDKYFLSNVMVAQAGGAACPAAALACVLSRAFCCVFAFALVF